MDGAVIGVALVAEYSIDGPENGVVDRAKKAISLEQTKVL